MCTGRVDLAFVLRAFQQGASGVIIGGCWPGDCHYVTEGNYDALGNTYLCKRLLQQVGVDPARLRIEWIGASEGNRFAELMNDFAAQLQVLGPLGQGEGTDAAGLQLKLDALVRLVPYLKLVEREKLRVPTRTEEAYRTFYESDEVSRLFGELVADKLVLSQILTCLREGPRSTGELSARLGFDPQEVARHILGSSRQGLVRYDTEQKRYALA